MRNLEFIRLGALIVLFFYIKTLFAQEITVYGQRNLWHAENLCDVEFTGCDWRLLNQGSMLGYAYPPNGSLWLVLIDQIQNGIDHLNIFDVEIENCKYTLLYTIPLPKYWTCSAAVNIDYLGRLYVTTIEYDTILNKSLGTLSRIANPAQPVIERVFIIYPQQRFFEVHFSRDRIYMVEIDKPYIRVFDTNFVLLDTIIMQKHIWGLTSFSYGCDSIKTYATHMSITTQQYVNTHPDTIMYISEYNLETNVLSEICNYNMGNNVANTQLTSPLEFLSSDPECDLLVDLDRDNSTGVYPYDYIDSTVYCTTVETPVCDEDVYIHTSAPLDSIRITLSGIQEPGFESVIMPVVIPGVIFIMRDDSTYVLISASGTDSLYREALLGLRYEHNGQLRSGGERHVILQGFNAVKDGVKIKARIQISSLPYAGEDVNLLICSDTMINSLSHMTGGQAYGYWWPTLYSGGDAYNSFVDLSIKYNYIIADPVCGNDTSVVSIIRDPASHTSILGSDQVLCAGDTIELNAGIGATTINWDDGSMGELRKVTIPGFYWVSIATPGGCTFHDSLHIEAGEIWKPGIEKINPVCNLDNGQIWIDSVVYLNGSAFLIDNVQIPKHFANNLAEGTYRVSTVSKDGCIWDELVTITNQEGLEIEIDSVIYVQEGLWYQMDYKEINAVGVADILFDPTNFIQWQDGTIGVFGDQDREYIITFIDDNGCVDLHKLEVKVEKSKGIYLPNIFSPVSTSGNNTWQAFINPPYELEFMRIYDRWGNMMYHSENEATWDGLTKGEICAPGVYVYQLVVTNNITGERSMLKGNLTLVR